MYLQNGIQSSKAPDNLTVLSIHFSAQHHLPISGEQNISFDFLIPFKSHIFLKL